MENYDAKSILIYFRRNEINKILKLNDVQVNGNLKLDVLIDWCLENISDKIPELFSDYTTICFNDIHLGNKNKIYKYLHRKFDFESIWDKYTNITTSVQLLKTDLPDDQVTEMLIKFNHYARNS